MDSIFDKFNDDEEQMKFGADMRKYELYVIVSYIIPLLFWMPIAIDKESDFCKFHANQSLCWLIVFAVLETFSGILGSITQFLNMFAVLINFALILCMVFLAVGAYKGYAIKIPVLGSFIKLFK
ncbi:MAG: hypothetical protein Q4A05_08810 [Ruminococcus sp.]|nr:hypothetical protein [Ruminococcus sp.]